MITYDRDSSTPSQTEGFCVVLLSLCVSGLPRGPSSSSIVQIQACLGKIIDNGWREVA